MKQWFTNITIELLEFPLMKIVISTHLICGDSSLIGMVNIHLVIVNSLQINTHYIKVTWSRDKLSSSNIRRVWI